MNETIDETMDYSKLLDEFRCTHLKEPCLTSLFGYGKTISQIERQIDLNKNFIVTGPSGVGKTKLVRHIADSRKELNFIYIKTSWFFSKIFGDPELQLRALFEEALKNPKIKEVPSSNAAVKNPKKIKEVPSCNGAVKNPKKIKEEPSSLDEGTSLIFFDDVSHLFSKKRNQTDSEKRILYCLENWLDNLDLVCSNTANKKVVIAAATDQPELIDPMITKYLQKEISVPLPSCPDRLKKLKDIFPDFADQERKAIADATNSYLFRDLDNLRDESLDERLETNYDSVKAALATFKPKTIKDYTSPCRPLKWEDIGGVKHVKRDLQKTVIDPIKYPGIYEIFCEEPRRGVLLYGPPGCSKTMLAQALATEGGYNFISVQGPELFTKYVGDSEAAVRRLYRNAREIAPCIIFFDEIDGFAKKRSDSEDSAVNVKVVTQLLTEFNGPPDGVFTIAATNMPWKVDSALMRPGRLDSAIYIPLPSQEDRAEIFRVHMKRRPVKFDESQEVVTEKLAEKTKGFSGADIAMVCKVAGELAFEEAVSFVKAHAQNCDIPKMAFRIQFEHFTEALKRVKPSVKSEEVKLHDDYYSSGLEKGGRVSLAVGKQEQLNGQEAARNLADKFNDSLNLE